MSLPSFASLLSTLPLIYYPSYPFDTMILLTHLALAVASCSTVYSAYAPLPSALGSFSQATPLAEPCYSNYEGHKITPDNSACSKVEANYDNEFFLADNFAGYFSPNWGMCQANGQRCVLNFSAPNSGVSPNDTCCQGSIPSLFLTIHNVSDVQQGLSFANQHKLLLVVKNTGHDYKGRSSGPGTAALWMHEYQPPITLTKGFTPEGCHDPVGRSRDLSSYYLS
jgi:hypothetical protein